MSEEFAFNARQFFDFSQDHEDMNGDSFFEMVHEDDPLKINSVKEFNVINEEVVETEISDNGSDSVFFSPNSPVMATGDGSAGASASMIYLKSKMRKSLSLSNLPVDDKPEELQQAMDVLSLEHNEIERPTSSCSQPERKFASQEHINRLAQPKRFTSSDNINLAEAVKKFQAGTPKRFRTRPSPKMNKFGPVPWGGTRGHSPKLLTTQRARPANILSHEDREKLEMEEAKKFKIRAKPVNKKILKGPMKPHVDKKPPTQMEPFNLTEVKKKEQVELPKIPPFKAQPLPKSMHNPYKPQEGECKLTKAPTASTSKRLNKSLPKMNGSDKVDAAPKPFKPTRTTPMPFSFERRDQQMLKKKEEFINKVLEEERKAREFHARPPPKAVLRSRNRSLDRTSEASSTKSDRKNSEEICTTTFKARPASVLYVKPFEPKKEEHDIKISPFQFITDQRLEARHKFEELLKERDMIKESMRKELEELQKKKEEEEVAKLRKQTEYKAQPIRKYKEITIKPSNKVTQPVSPIFHTDRLRNKENIEH